jgi:soluble lytic murein transglycosylase-like protein
MRRALVLALVLAPALAARAEIVVLASGAVLKTTGRRIDGPRVRVTLSGGGEVALSPASIRAILPDEVVSAAAGELSRAVPGDLAELIDAAARKHGLDPALVRAVVAVESGFRPDAVSPKGAQGLMQLMPGTASLLDVRHPLDPAENLDGGTRHLGALLDRYGGDLGLSLAAYNAGEGAVTAHGGVPPYPETRAYLRAVLDRYRGGARLEKERTP